MKEKNTVFFFKSDFLLWYQKTVPVVSVPFRYDDQFNHTRASTTARTTGERKFSHVVLSRLRLDITFLWPTSIIKCLSQAIYISNVFRNKTENSNPQATEAET